MVRRLVHKIQPQAKQEDYNTTSTKYPPDRSPVKNPTEHFPKHTNQLTSLKTYTNFLKTPAMTLIKEQTQETN